MDSLLAFSFPSWIFHHEHEKGDSRFEVKVLVLKTMNSHPPTDRHARAQTKHKFIPKGALCKPSSSRLHEVED